jgi:hypothetical protein
MQKPETSWVEDISPVVLSLVSTFEEALESARGDVEE